MEDRLAEEVSAAVTLRARDYSVSDRIVTLLTRDYGKLAGIAKGGMIEAPTLTGAWVPVTGKGMYPTYPG